MSMNRTISFLFMIITVLSGQPEDSINIFRQIDITKSSLQLQQIKQNPKAYDHMLFAANHAEEGNHHEKLQAVLGDHFSINRVLFEHYALEAEHQSVILIQKNDLWKHAVF